MKKSVSTSVGASIASSSPKVVGSSTSMESISVDGNGNDSLDVAKPVPKARPPGIVGASWAAVLFIDFTSFLP